MKKSIIQPTGKLKEIVYRDTKSLFKDIAAIEPDQKALEKAIPNVTQLDFKDAEGNVLYTMGVNIPYGHSVTLEWDNKVRFS